MKEEIANKINELDIFSYQERRIKEIVKKDDEYTKQVIKDYFIKKYPKKNIKFDFLDEEIVDEIIKLGIAEYQKRQALGGVKMENSIEEDIKILEELRIANENCIKNAKNKDNPFVTIWEKQNRALEHILSAYKRVLKENEEFKREIERQKDINIIINKKGIDKCYEKILEKTMTKFLNNNIANDFIPKKKSKRQDRKIER